jgi:hypothetical protein
VIEDLILKFFNPKGMKLTNSHIQNLWEIYKVEQDDKKDILQRVVAIKELMSRKLNRKGKRLDELI